MNETNSAILLNFLEVSPKDFSVTVYCKRLEEFPEEERKQYYQKRLKVKEGADDVQPYAIVFDPANGFEERSFRSDFNTDITKQYLLNAVRSKLQSSGVELLDTRKDKYQRVYILLKSWSEGKETIWLEPYYLTQTRSFGFLVDYKFWVDQEYKAGLTGSVDKRILQLSGTLDSKGLTNRAFYQFKYEKLKILFASFFPKFQSFSVGGRSFTVSSKLTEVNSFSLNTKVYQFANGKESNSPYNGLKQNQPFEKPEIETRYIFVFKENDREFAIRLLNGLKGQVSPSTFEGIEKMFKIPFNNGNITGEKVKELSVPVIQGIISKIKAESNESTNILPVILTNSKTAEADHKIYYGIKNAFTKEDIPCQVVTKDLVLNSNSLKYSLSNIGLQIFAKAGGKPWKVKPAIKNCLIIGIGNKNKEVFQIDDAGNRRRKIEKFLTYSVLTDSSGLFKEIQILSETDNEEDYYKSLVNKLTSIIKQAAKEGNKDIVVHSPFRISKPKVWDVVFRNIPQDLNISILLINDHHKYFGFDISKNSLVPYESTCIALSEHEYLVWFEGLQYQNTTISKMIGSPIYINFWYANRPDLLSNATYRKSLLQDCINLSGANWRGFKAKQLPVSIFYCQKIADFLKMFEDYGFEHIEFENLKPWFL